jgi:hypothetical protein
MHICSKQLPFLEVNKLHNTFLIVKHPENNSQKQ